jgi:hypothetical protein
MSMRSYLPDGISQEMDGRHVRGVVCWPGSQRINVVAPMKLAYTTSTSTESSNVQNGGQLLQKKCINTKT